MNVSKVKELLDNIDEMIQLEEKKLDTLRELRQAWRIRMVLPDIPPKQPVKLVVRRNGFKGDWRIVAADTEYPLTLREYNYIRGERDDF